MGWDKGRYYTRSRKVNGRVIREYIGGGEIGEICAELDALKRDKRRLEALDLRIEKAELDDLDAEIKAVIDATDLVARAALLAAGCHLHKRGEWRKKRGNRQSAECGTSNRSAGDAEAAGARPGGR